MGVLFSNNASAPIATNISATDTTITLAGGQGGEFPAPLSGDHFYATLTNAANQIEIIRVVNRTGNVVTVLRGQEGTAARAYLAGDLIELRVTAQGLNDILLFPPSGNLVSTTIITAINELDAKKAGLSLNNTFTGSNTFNNPTTYNNSATFSGATSFASTSNFASSSTVSFQGSVTSKNAITADVVGTADVAKALSPTSTYVTPPANGGTGSNSLTVNGVVVADPTTFYTIAPGASGNVLVSNGSIWQSATSGLVGTTWTDLTGQRGIGSTYTNTSGRTIGVLVQVVNTNGIWFYINGSLVWREFYDVNPGAGQTGRSACFVLVPNGSNYSAAAGNLALWWELR